MAPHRKWYVASIHSHPSITHRIRAVVSHGSTAPCIPPEDPSSRMTGSPYRVFPVGDQISGLCAPNELPSGSLTAARSRRCVALWTRFSPIHITGLQRVSPSPAASNQRALLTTSPSAAFVSHGAWFAAVVDESQCPPPPRSLHLRHSSQGARLRRLRLRRAASRSSSCSSPMLTYKTLLQSLES